MLLFEGVMAAVLKLFRSGKEKKKAQSQHYLDIGEIGMPTQVSYNFSGRILPDGTIEATSAEKAVQLCRCKLEEAFKLSIVIFNLQVDRHKSKRRSK